MLLVAGGVTRCTATDGIEFFETRIRPVLARHCYEFHSVQDEQSGNLKGGVRLDMREHACRGGHSGPAVVPVSVADSLLIPALRQRDGLEMSPERNFLIVLSPAL